jgi:nicotinamide-nucleotide amidase
MIQDATPAIAILAIGEEVLSGEIVNSNAAWIAQECLARNWSVLLHLCVTDEPADIHYALETCRNMGISWVITTGGLGPTPDDLTVEAMASYHRAPLELDAYAWEEIRQKFAKRGLPCPASNQKQAMRPQNARFIENPKGTAPALFWPTGWGLITAFPGVPRELKVQWPLMLEAIRANFRPWFQAPEQFETQVWIYGLGESHLLERLRPELSKLQSHWAPYVSNDGRVRLRLRNANPEQLAEEAGLLRGCLPENVFAITTDDVGLEKVVGRKLLERRETVAVAESCTGGLLSSKLTDVAGSSGYCLGNLVSYANSVKTQWLQIDAETLRTHGAVSEPVAARMAEQVASLFETTWGLSTTGIAGPGGGTETKPVGLVFIGLHHRPSGQTRVLQYEALSYLSRTETKARFVNEALYQLWLQLEALTERSGLAISG